MGEWPSSLSSHLGYDNGFARNNLAEANINFARTSFHHWMLLQLNWGLWNGCCSGQTSGTHHRSNSRKGCRNHCWNLESLLVAQHWFGLHTLVIRSIPWCHIHSRPLGILIWWYSFSTSYCWCVVTPIPIITTGMIGFPGHPLPCLDCTLSLKPLIYLLVVC